MFNDFDFLNGDDSRMNLASQKTKDVFGENYPYYLYDTGIGRDQNLLVFTDHFITTMRLVLSDPTGATIVQMSKEEKSLYFDYVDFQNDTYVEGIRLDRDTAVHALDQCIADEINCQTQTWLSRAFDATLVWDPNDLQVLEPATLTVQTTLETYNSIEPLSTTTYIINDGGIVVKIAIGTITIWEL